MVARHRLSTAFAVALMCIICATAMCHADEAVNLTTTEPASEREMIRYEDRKVAIRGKVYDYFIEATRGLSFATWRVPNGPNVFEAYCGFNDEYNGEVRSAAFSVLLDGELAKTVTVTKGEKAALLSVAVTAGQSLRLEVRYDCPENESLWGNCTGVIAEPRLIKGGPATASSSGSPSTSTAKYKCSVCGKTFDLLGERDMHTRMEHGGPGTGTGGGSVVADSAAQFVVDPNDLERLAIALRKRVDSKPDVKTRVDRGKAALMTFTLVDIVSQSVAINVAEDLYTSMINSDFRLVERGQLDKMIKELKIQDSALIDPATAEKIGKVSGCDMIILGSISDRGNVVVVNARIMETSTGTSIAAERVEMKKNLINR